MAWHIRKYSERSSYMFQRLHAAGTTSSAKAIFILMISRRELRRVNAIISNLIPVVFSAKKWV